jgi:hypothetical protein
MARNPAAALITTSDERTDFRTTIQLPFSGGSQTYIEDCQVCCQPMGVVVDVGADGEQSVRVERAS